MKRVPVNRLRIGISRAPFFDLLDEDVARCVDAAIERIESLDMPSVAIALKVFGERECD